MKFPKTIRFRKAEAKIYDKRPGYAFYRVAAYVGGKRRMSSFGTYTEALASAEKLVREIAAGSQVAELSAAQGRDALTAIERLQDHYRATGRKVGLVDAVIEYCRATSKLGDRPLVEAVDGYLSTIVVVKRKDLAEAVSEFNAPREAKTMAAPGKRPALHPTYVKDTCRWLNEFSTMFPGHAICDLEKQHLDLYLAQFNGLSVKSRNDRRAILTMFIGWCTRQDFLPQNHRLLEAESLKREPSDFGLIDFYRPAEFRALLDNAPDQMRAVIAVQGLAGVRLQEALRLTWRDVFSIPGHIEISSVASKNRARRLVPICTSLELWLQPFRAMKPDEKVSSQWQTLNGYTQRFAKLREALKIPSRKNGMRHAWVTYRYALTQNENEVASLAGNSPAMVHGHYKGLATHAEAEEWFAVAPSQAENVIPMKTASQ